MHVPDEPWRVECTGDGMRAPHPFALRHVVFLLALFGIAVLLRSNTGLLVHFRFPGMLLLVVAALYLATRESVRMQKR